jgi:hypothetical protein
MSWKKSLKWKKNPRGFWWSKAAAGRIVYFTCTGGACKTVPTGMAATYSKQPSPEMPPNHVILIFNPSKEKLRGNFVFILHVLADFQLNPEIIHFINFISSVVEFLNGVIFY